MTGEVRIFVNEQAIVVSGDQTIAAAVAAFDHALSEALSGKSGYLTDGVGRRLAPDTVVEEGMIVRVISGGRPTEER